MNKIELVIFDMDGTLIDTTELFLQAYEYVLQQHNLGHKTREELKQIIVKSKTILESYRSLIPSQDVETYLQTHHNFRESNQHLAKAFPNTVTVLETLRKSGIKVAAFTNRSKLVPEILKETGIFHLLDKVITAEDAGAHKPNPAGIQLLLKHFQVFPESAIMVGDTEVDTFAGKAAGLTTVGVLSGFVPSNVQASNPDFLIEDIAEILPLILKK